MHCSPPQPHSVVYGEAYRRGISVSRRQNRQQRGGAEMLNLNLSMCYENWTSSTKPEVRNFLHCNQRSNKPQLQVIYKKFGESWDVWFLRYVSGETDIHACWLQYFGPLRGGGIIRDWPNLLYISYMQRFCFSCRKKHSCIVLSLQQKMTEHFLRNTFSWVHRDDEIFFNSPKI